MNRNKLNYIIILLLSILIFSCNTKKEKLNFPRTIIINNINNDKRIDTVLMVLVNKIYNYDTL